MKKLLTATLALISLCTNAQEIAYEYPAPNYIKTIQFNVSEQNTLPLYRMNERIEFSFDDLEADEKNYYYEIKHYDSDWTLSDLSKNDYMEGYDGVRIFDYVNSYGTLQPYNHFMLSIPNDYTRRLKVSGNYMLFIYDDYDDLVFSKRFLIAEDLSNIQIEIKRSRDVRQINTHQMVNYRVTPRGIQFIDPNSTVKTVIYQNGNINRPLIAPKPQFNVGQELLYRYGVETTFAAGNEFLFFESRDIRTPTIRINFIEFENGIYQHYLFTDTNRSSQSYTYYPDINGNFKITTTNNVEVERNADYVRVHFALVTLPPKAGNEIHLYGNFNQYNLTEDTLMLYNEDSGMYEGSLLLKQGFYNYKYVVLESNGNIDEGFISGNYWQTENAYHVLAYYREPGSRFDRLLGVGLATSVDISN